MKMSAIWLYMLIISMFSGLHVPLVAYIVSKRKIILAFTLISFISIVIYLLNDRVNFKIPLQIIIVGPYELLVQLCCFILFKRLVGRNPSYGYSDEQLFSPGFTIDNAYILIILILGAVPLVTYANYLHSKL